MKRFIVLVFVIFWSSIFAQSISEKEDALVAEVSLPIWDVKNSESLFEIDTLMYDEIPKYLDFRGTAVTVLKWTDIKGENIMILSKSGAFDWKDYDGNDHSKFDLQDKSELFIYLFQKQKGSDSYRKLWRIYDFIECFGVDRYVGFKKNATTITDLDKDGVAEVTIPYALFCRGGMDPGIMKIMMYEGSKKYALRGETAICRDGVLQYGGVFNADEVTKKNKIFYNFLMRHWKAHECE